MTPYTAEQHLENLQRKACEQYGIDTDKYIIQRMLFEQQFLVSFDDWLISKAKRNRDELVADWSNYFDFPAPRSSAIEPDTEGIKEVKRKVFGKLPNTPYQQPALMMLMSYYATLIEEAIENLSLELPLESSVILGTIPSGMYNAQRIWFGDEEIVAFDQGTFAFIDKFKNVVPTQSLQYRGEPVNIRAQEIVNSLLYAHLVEGDPYQSEVTGKISHLPPLYERIAVYQFRDPLFLFMMGHEYAHIIHKHHDKSHLNSLSIGGKTVKSYNNTWTQEYEADFRGFQLALQVYLDSDNPMGLAGLYTGVDYMFHVLQLIEKSLSVLISGDERMLFADSSHPPLLSRQRALQSAVLRGLDVVGVNAIGVCVMQNEALFNNIWKETKPYMLRLHNSGVKPFKIWDGKIAVSTYQKVKKEDVSLSDEEKLLEYIKRLATNNKIYSAKIIKSFGELFEETDIQKNIINSID